MSIVEESTYRPGGKKSTPPCGADALIASLTAFVSRVSPPSAGAPLPSPVAPKSLTLK